MILELEGVQACFQLWSLFGCPCRGDGRVFCGAQQALGMSFMIIYWPFARSRFFRPREKYWDCMSIDADKATESLSRGCIEHLLKWLGRGALKVAVAYP